MASSKNLSHTYDDSDAMTRRTLTESAIVIRHEKYRYDLRGRLTQYDCEGTQPPVDPDGKIITQQLFGLDGVDNLTVVLTTFGAVSKRARYSYDGADPVQLSKVTITRLNPSGPVEVINLAYDADGNLISDEAGRSLKYDALVRLIEVGTQPTGSQYRDNPLDNLTGEPRNSEQGQRFYRDGSGQPA